MIWEEAVAQGELEKQFWADLRHSEEVFLWRPRRNSATGKLMWLCQAVEATSGYTINVTGAEFEFTQVRWYKPKDFTILSLLK